MSIVSKKTKDSKEKEMSLFVEEKSTLYLDIISRYTCMYYMYERIQSLVESGRTRRKEF